MARQSRRDAAIGPGADARIEASRGTDPTRSVIARARLRRERELTFRPHPLDGLRGCGHLRQTDLDWFGERAVSPFALAGYRASPAEIASTNRLGLSASTEAAHGDVWFFVARAPVRFLRGGRFVFLRETRGEPEDAVTAYILPEVDAVEDTADLVAWHPRTGRLASWLGLACLLGGSALAEIDDGPLLVHSTPLGWLAAWRRGVVVVHETAATRRLLEARMPLQAENVDHGLALRAMLTRVHLPPILVPSDDPKAAA